MGTTAAARRHRADPHVVRVAAPHCSALVPQSSVPQLGSTGVAGTLGHGTKIRYISFPDVHNLYSSLPEPKLLDHGTKIRYISVPEVPTRYRTKKYLLGTKFFVANRIKLWRIDIRYLTGHHLVELRHLPALRPLARSEGRCPSVARAPPWAAPASWRCPRSNL